MTGKEKPFGFMRVNWGGGRSKNLPLRQKESDEKRGRGIFRWDGSTAKIFLRKV
jgi:hypothetical protein